MAERRKQPPEMCPECGEELKKQVQRLENELQLVKLEKESEKVESLFPMELTATLLRIEL